MAKSREEIAKLVRARPALFLGENAVSSAYDRDRLLSIVRNHLIANGVSNVHALGDDIDRLIDESRKYAGVDAIEWAVRRAWSEISPIQDCTQLARINWSAVISGARSLAFERAIAERLENQPIQKEVTRVSHPSQNIPRRSIPVFRLFGEPTHLEIEHSMPQGSADLSFRRPIWRDLLRRFPDFALGSPLFVAGVRSSDSGYLEALGALFSLSGPVPTEIVFIDCESDEFFGPFRHQLERRATLTFLGRALPLFCDYVAELFRPNIQLDLTAPVEQSVKDILTEYSDQISVPQTSLPASFNADSHYHELCDALFRPVSTDWRPFIAGLDFRRDCIDQIKEDVAWAATSAAVGTTPVVTVVGEAGIGKTTALKRVAFEIASEGTLVLWVKRSFASDARERVHKLVDRLSASIKNLPAPLATIVVICDDPAGCGIDPDFLTEKLNNSSLRACVVFAWRSSESVSGSVKDWQTRFPSKEYPIPYGLSDDELLRFPKFLQVSKIVDNETRGVELLRTLPKGEARVTDILCSLWFLVPATRHQLEQSITEEFLRLGHSATSVEALAQFASNDASIAKNAYEAVAVCSALELPLPIEVLVASLEVKSYSDWLAVASPGRPVWGLIYDDVNNEAGTITYRTRNVVVTEVITRHIRGDSGSTGEYRVLRRLVNACIEGGEAYEEFLTELLVRRSKQLQQHLSYPHGMELYSLAISAKLRNSSVVEHHRGIWARKMGRDFKKANESFENALSLIRQEDGAGERRENVLVSMASTSVDEMAANLMSPQAARQTIEDKLSEVRMLRGFHPHASHVLVRSLNKVAVHPLTPPDQKVAALCQALEESERVVMLLSGSDRVRASHQESLEIMLAEQATSIIQMNDDESALDSAYAMASGGSTRALVAIAYKWLFQAARTDKGSDFNKVFEFCNDAIQKYGSCADASRLHKARALVVSRWRMYEPRGAIDWKGFRSDIDIVLKSEKFSDDPIWAYFHVLACAHIDGLLASQSAWAALRSLGRDHPTRHAIRNFYLGPEGQPKKLQAVVRKANGRLYANILGENVDVPIADYESKFRMDDSIACYLVFSFMGPTIHFGKSESLVIRPAVPAI